MTGLAVVSCVVLAAVLASACGGSDGSEAEPPRPPYDLTHTAADAEAVIGWDAIVAACPDVGALQRVEAFARRGEKVPVGSDTTLEVKAGRGHGLEVPAVRRRRRSGRSRRIQVAVSFIEKRGVADEQLRLTAQRTSAASLMVGAAGGMRVSVEEGDGFVFSRMDSDIPTRAEQRFVASDNVLVHIIQTVRAGPGSAMRLRAA